ncbi:MAG: PolC-type DNA polymerase III, partial [Oscillospiraceae bacterium]|nr:PolC-type DNA polymerase III [Oscillospiraceae bacterium]
LKIDALGHDDPTVIKMLEDLTGVDSRTIPLDDKKVMSLFKSTKALGVTPEQIGTKVGTLAIPEFGTGFVQKMLLDTKPTTFSELVRISGLSHGEDVWLGNVQEYIRQGKTTLKEASCTRDDIMLYLIYNGLPAKDAFDIMERVRKDKTRPTREDEELMREKKIPEWYIESCNKIKYLFPKAHAVAYVTMAFKIAWFKVYYPLEFYLAYLTVRADEFNISLMADIDLVRKNIKRLESEENSLNQKDKNVLSILQVVREMFARGFKFLPVDLYKSDIKGFEVEGDAIRPPLIAVQGLGLSVAETIDSARNEAEFSSIEDLKNRTKTNKAIIELLEEQGVLAGLPASDQMSFF